MGETVIRRYRSYKYLISAVVLICLSSAGTLAACATQATPNPTSPIPTTPSLTPTPTAATPTSIPTTAMPAPIPPLTTTSLPSGKIGFSYNASLVASGGTTPYTWSLISGSLPPGLTVSAAGIIGGTPTSAGSFTFTIQVKDSGSSAMTALGTLSITIVPLPLTITTTSLPSWRIGIGYGASLVASGGTTPYTWSLVSGSLPPGLTLSPAGIISGMPTSAGTSSFTFEVRDSSTPALAVQGTLSVTIAPLLTVSTVIPLGTVDTSYNASLLASAGTAPYTWSLVSGSLPPGLALSPGGIISGRPTSVGRYDLIVQVVDSSTPTLTAQVAISISVTYPTPTDLIMVTSDLRLATTGNPYSATLVASGGTGVYTWSLISGILPPGLGMTASIISGTPTSAGSFTFTIQVKDTGSPAMTVQRSFTLVVSTRGY